MTPQLRIARPVSDLARTESMYRSGLGWQVVGRFADHDGFDGVMLGLAGADHHVEFTRHRADPVAPTPTPEDLIVVYLPEHDAWERACARMLGAGFVAVASHNPYWDARGRTFSDHDGYRVVLQHDAWRNVPEP